jgi:hypothetical protein
MAKHALILDDEDLALLGQALDALQKHVASGVASFAKSVNEQLEAERAAQPPETRPEEPAEQIAPTSGERGRNGRGSKHKVPV